MSQPTPAAVALLAKSIAAKKENKNMFSLEEKVGRRRARRGAGGMDCAGALSVEQPCINHGKRGVGENPAAQSGGRVCWCETMLLPMSQGACASLSAPAPLLVGDPQLPGSGSGWKNPAPLPSLLCTDIQILNVSLTPFPHADVP